MGLVMGWLALSPAEALATDPKTATGGPTNAPESVLRIQIAGEPVSLDPMMAEDTLSTRILANTMDGLVGYSPQGQLEPRIAERWEISQDRLTYRFYLRPNAKWSDGRTVTSDDFVAAFRRALSPGSQARFIDLFLAIRGAAQFRKSGTNWAQVGIKATPNSLEFQLERPASYWLAALTLPVAGPTRVEILKDNSGKWPVLAPSTGRYTLVRVKAGERIELQRNSYHWSLPTAQATPPLSQPANTMAGETPSRVELQILPNEAQALELFKKGELDILTKLSSRDYEALQSSGELKRMPLSSTYFLGFNLEKMPFKDRHFRRAVAGVIQRQSILTDLGSGDAPARYWIPPGLEGHLQYAQSRIGSSRTSPHASSSKASSHPNSNGYFHGSRKNGRRRSEGTEREAAPSLRDSAFPVDPVFEDSVEKIRTLLARRVIPLVTATYDTAHKNAVVMNHIQKQLKAGLDLKVQLSSLDWKAYIQALHSDPPSLFRLGWQAPIPDPLPHLQVFTSGNPHNYVRWSNARYDQLVKTIAELPVGKERSEKIAEAQRLLIDEEAVIVPIFHYVQYYAVSRRVAQFPMNSYGILRYDAMTLQGNSAAPLH
jgi:oligopeptide transport system substrate-binding protein